MDVTAINVINRRDAIIGDLRRELVGPDPSGVEIDVSRRIEFEDRKESYGPWRQAGSGEEILIRDAPTTRYGVGVLFPIGALLEEIGARTGLVEDTDTEEVPEPVDVAVPDAFVDEKTGMDGARASEEEDEEFDLSLANAYQPSSMGVSFLADFPTNAVLTVSVEGARYVRKTVFVQHGGYEERPRTWWLRRPVTFRATFDRAEIVKASVARCEFSARCGGEQTGTDGSGDLSMTDIRGRVVDLSIEVLSRPHGANQCLLTVCLVNRTKASRTAGASEACFFQSRLRVSVEAPVGNVNILPYPGTRPGADPDERSLALLYRNQRTFATGHGCSADWEPPNNGGRVSWVSGEPLPVVEVPNVTPDIKRDDGSRLAVEMAPLAGLVPGNPGIDNLAEVIELYERWIEKERSRAETLDTRFREAATDHLAQCTRAAERMRDGLAFLGSDEKARVAFRLANHAILLQQLASVRAPRTIDYDGKTDSLRFSHDYQTPNVGDIPEGRGTWRAFQIAFLLACIRSAVDGRAPDRRTVELIWFPTGGGKTEAYLALAAFSIFYRRLVDPSDAGVHVLMRYTLRLLTAQQFQRASALICAMEVLRQTTVCNLGQQPFSIGIWLGGEATPNTREQAKEALAKLKNDKRADNRFLLARCPWCSAQFKIIEAPNRSMGRKAKGKPTVLTPGYVLEEGTVIFRCPDASCPFADRLPVFVVDEDIYARRPTFVIGTIDKFAMLAWRPAARALFNVDEFGDRMASPPGLIIQDELHLISGPLGSLAGLYETVIEELCTDRRVSPPILPKIITSTATIRRYADQVAKLYARDNVELFPPRGLDVGDSFFARYDEDNAGRVYVGVHAVSLGSVQTEWARTFASLLQAPTPLHPSQRDPWWTLMVFFNSIREMGTAHTLFQSDVPDYLRVIWNRRGLNSERRRYLSGNRIFELTGGLSSGKISEAMTRLEVDCASAGAAVPVDVCLASSVIEVGIDIPRLSLMVVAGQPKTTSQYIQVTGRVGRRPDRPGLVVTMYSPSKPRDRSHFEGFRSYHERLYAQVEPTSVTPFSPPALDRALHAVLAAYIRQVGGSGTAASPYPFPGELVEKLRLILEERVGRIDVGEAQYLTTRFARLTRELKTWQRAHWERSGKEQDIPQLRGAGEYASQEEQRLSWATPRSMRNVDAGCEAAITTLYLDDEERIDA